MEAKYRLLLVCSDEKYFNYSDLVRTYMNYDFLNLHIVETNDVLGYSVFLTLEGLEIILANSKYFSEFSKDSVFYKFDLYQELSPHSIPAEYKWIFKYERRANSIALLNILYEAKKGLDKKKLNNKYGLTRMEEEYMKNDKNLIVYKSEKEMAEEFIIFGKKYGNYVGIDYAAINVARVIQDQRPRLDLGIKDVIFNNPATIVLWNDGTKTVVKVQDGDRFDPEKGLTMAIVKKLLGNQGNYYNYLKKWLPEEEKVEFGVTFANANEALRQTIKRLNETMGKSALSEDEEKGD